MTFYIIDFENLDMSTELEFAFLNTAKINFCFIYSLNVSHSNQNPSFFPVEDSAISPCYKNNFEVSFRDLTIVIGDRLVSGYDGTYKLHSLFIVFRPST